MLVTEDNVVFAMLALHAANEIAVDTETSGLNVQNGVDYLMGISFTTDDGFSCYMPFRHKENNLDRKYLKEVNEILCEKDLIWHHRKFDMHSLKTIGIDPLMFKGIQYCTMLLFHMWNEEQYSFELDQLGKRWLKMGKIGADEIALLRKWYGQENIPAENMSPYACQDTNVTFDLKRFIWPKIIAEGLDKVYLETEMPFTRLLYKLEQRGVGVDKEFAGDRARIGRLRMATIQRTVRFNPASTKDLKRILIDELGLPVLAHTDSCQDCKRGHHYSTHEGKPSFNKKVMEEYDDILNASSNPTARLVGEYRGWQKAVTSLYEPILEKCGPDGLLRTEFKQHGTVTGRLSAKNPNLQQVPRHSDNPWNGNAKSAFTSGRDGFTLIGWDYSQLELRLAASYGGEDLLLTEFKKPDADPFSVLAPLIFGYLSPESRQETKTFVYANLYGAGVRKIASQLGRPVYEVEDLYKNYKESISGIMNISRQVTKLMEQRKFVKYWDGRKRHIRNKNESYKAWNSVCQGGGAQLVKKAMLRCEEFEDDNCFMVLQVHDEITFCIREGMIEEYEKKIKEAMTDWPQLGVNLTVEGKEWK